MKKYLIYGISIIAIIFALLLIAISWHIHEMLMHCTIIWNESCTMVAVPTSIADQVL